MLDLERLETLAGASGCRGSLAWGDCTQLLAEDRALRELVRALLRQVGLTPDQAALLAEVVGE